LRSGSDPTGDSKMSRTERRAPTPTEMVLVDGVLTMLFRRMRGALDLGLALLLEATAERYEAFVSDHVAAPMRAGALVLRLAVAEAVTEPALSPFVAIQADTEAFVAAPGELATFRSVPRAQLEDTAARLGTAYHRLRDSFLDVAERLGFEPAIARDATPDRDALYAIILDRLHGDLTTERTGSAT